MMQSFFIIAKYDIYGVNSHSELNVKTLHAEMIHFHYYEPRTCVKNK